MVTVEQVQNRGKVKVVSFSIDEEVNKRFIEIANKLKINKSLFIEKAIIEFLEQCEER